MDPTASVARTEHLVLWSRLGKRFRVADLERMLWEEHSLFEYWAHIVPTADFGIHRDAMRRFLDGNAKRHTYIREWLAANAGFRRYVLRELKARGPLRTRELEDRTAEGWRTGGWNDDGRSTGMMLEVLWGRGEIMVAGRDGGQRLWDLGERVVPVHEPKVRPDRDRAPGRGDAASGRGDHAAEATRPRVAPQARGLGPGAREARARGPRRSRVGRRPAGLLVHARRSARAAAAVPPADRPALALRRPRQRPQPQPSVSSTSDTGSRSTSRRPSASSATSCCRSCTASG